MAPLGLSNVQSQIRLTAFRLGQLREKHHQTSNITKRDVATLISQGEISVARTKVEKLMRDDKLSSLLERLQFYCSLLLEKVADLGHLTDFESKSPLLEAVCSVMLVASRTELQDVLSLRGILVQMYGQEFNRRVVKHYPNHVPLQIFHALDTRLPPAAQVDVYMATISNEYNLSWKPPLLPHQKSHALSEILDPDAFPRMLDVAELRQVCSRGIPPQPPWLRPRMWKLLLGTLSYQKDSWEIDAHTKRRSYYNLASPLFSRLNVLPLPSSPLSPLDAGLFNLAKSLLPLPKELHGILEQSPLCPFDSNAPDGLRIETANAVDQRLKLIQGHVLGGNTVNGMPEIHLDSSDDTLQMPQISVSSPIDSPTENGARKKSETLLQHSVLTRSHATSLLRLLYIHMSLHPSTSTSTSYLISILIPLYVVMIQEVEPTELAHVEPDTFWLLTELWGEVGELAEDEGSRIWVAKIGQRLASADPELSDDLCRKGLDPTLPHYSYRWLVPLLTRTLPLPSALTIWDSLFTQPQRTTNHNAKLEFLVDICTSLLINARMKLIRLGISAFKSPSLWGDVEVTPITVSDTPVEFEEGFIQGVALLQAYPIDDLGGPEKVIETAIGLGDQRKHAEGKGTAAFNLGERLRGTVWSSLMTIAAPSERPIPESNNESDGTPSPQWPDSGTEDDGHVTEKSGALFGKLGDTVWRGLTNQSLMNTQSSPLRSGSPAEPASPASNFPGTYSPNATGAEGIGHRLGNSIWRGLTNQSTLEPLSPTESTVSIPLRPESDGFATPSTSSSLWSYTGMLKDSDAAASLSKTRTNWTARAFALWGKSIPSSTASSPEYSHHPRTGSLSVPGKSWAEMFPKRGSLPTHYDKEYSPPPRPNFRETKYFSPQERNVPESPTRPVIGLSSPLLAKSKSAIASFTGTTSATPKSGPRPLILSSSSLITSHRPSRFPPSAARSSLLQDHISSTSSASTPLSVSQHHPDRDSAIRGRFVALRRGVTPRPSRSSRPIQSDTEDTSLQSLSPEIESEPLRPSFRSMGLRTHGRRRSSVDGAVLGWGQVELPDSPSTIPSSTPPGSPTAMTNNARVNRVSEGQRSSLALNVLDVGHLSSQIDTRVGAKKLSGLPVSPRPPVPARKVTSDSSTSQDNLPSIRNKRHGQRPTNLRLKKSDTDLSRSSIATIGEQRHNGDVNALVPASLSDLTAITPRAAEFRSPESPERPLRLRKNSRSPRPALRKIDFPDKETFSSDGDDEGYDDFLSAYESEQ